MAEKKIHKQEEPNKAEATPQVKKAVDLRKAGHSLREISEMLNISRTAVEKILAEPKPVKAEPVEKPVELTKKVEPVKAKDTKGK